MQETKTKPSRAEKRAAKNAKALKEFRERELRQREYEASPARKKDIKRLRDHLEGWYDI